MLSIRDVSVRFGGVTALKSVSFDAEPGRIVGLIGPNGSGKSTLLNVISGTVMPDAGAVTLDGAVVPLGRPERIAGYGIGRAFQVPRLARRLTVHQNLMASARDQGGERLFDLFLRPRRVAQQERALESRAWAVLQRLQLDHKANDLAGGLSGGQQKLLALGMLMMSDCRMLLLDEPAAGVNAVLVEEQIALLKAFRAEGRLIILVEHNMDMVAELCDCIYVLDAGEVIVAGTPAEIRGNAEVMRAYLGQPVMAGGIGTP